MSESRSDLALTAALCLVSPLVEFLLQEGVPYPRLTQALKASFLDAAAAILAARGQKVTDSSISMLSGVHRKDVREWRTVGKPKPPAKGLSVVAEVYTKWMSDPAYANADGSPRNLPRNGGGNSFEALAASVSTDVHPHTILRELIRLGISRIEPGEDEAGDRVCICADAFVPRQGAAEMLQIFADNVRDHMASAVHNLSSEAPAHLEQSVFADGLCPESAVALGTLARRLWASAFKDMVREATVLNEQDQHKPDADQRIRFGVYFYQAEVEKG